MYSLFQSVFHVTILFRHHPYSLVSHVRYVRVARAISCARIKSRVVGHVLFIAMEEKADQLSLDAEDALLNDESTSSETTSRQDP